MHFKGHQAMTSLLAHVPDQIWYGPERSHTALASSREFLMSEDTFFCSTSWAGNSRRHHGLFIDDGRIILSALHETINEISLLPGWWGERPPDEMLQYILSTRLYPVTQELSLQSALITKTIDLDHGLFVRWEVDGTADFTIRPLMIDRNIHACESDRSVFVTPVPDGYTWNKYHFRCQLPFTINHIPYYHARYPKDTIQGKDLTETLISPGYFSGTVTDTSIELQVYPDCTIPPPSRVHTTQSPDLLTRASQLCLLNGGIIAGYHWFIQEWGRDTFISMPGLLLSRGKYREAEHLFRKFLKAQKGGLIPNCIPDSYNSSDAPLWLFWALFHYLQTHQNSPFVDEILPDLEALISAYPDTEITHLDKDLITVTSGTTWMDTPYTPREGKPVEINALWILALEICDYLEIDHPVSPKRVRSAYYAYWNENTGCLFDVLDPDDPSVRPNQLIALSLGLVPFDEGRKALARIRNDLLTPYGLRSLAPNSPGYLGTYTGDASYHNGMVWPWFISWYIDAQIQYGESPDRASRRLLPLWHYFFTEGAGMLPELFNGDFPHAPAGAICQAWSIAEFIRARNMVLSYNPQVSEEK